MLVWGHFAAINYLADRANPTRFGMDPPPSLEHPRQQVWLRSLCRNRRAIHRPTSWSRPPMQHRWSHSPRNSSYQALASLRLFSKPGTHSTTRSAILNCTCDEEINPSNRKNLKTVFFSLEKVTPHLRGVVGAYTVHADGDQSRVIGVRSAGVGGQTGVVTFGHIE